MIERREMECHVIFLLTILVMNGAAASNTAAPTRNTKNKSWTVAAASKQEGGNSDKHRVSPFRGTCLDRRDIILIQTDSSWIDPLDALTFDSCMNEENGVGIVKNDRDVDYKMTPIIMQH